MPAKSYQPPRRARALRADGTPGAVFELGRSLPVALFRASHARQAVLITVGLTVAALLAGRSTRESALVLVTVLVGQVVLGWHNDVVDAERDKAHARENKPIAAGYLDKGTVTFFIAVAILALVPLSISHGLASGLVWLGIVLVGLLTNAGLLRRSQFSYLPWMVTFGLFPVFLSYGGWGGDGAGGPPTIAITVCSALLGIGAHVLASLPGLVDDNKDGSNSFPLKIALRTGAPRLLLLAGTYTAIVGAALLTAAFTSGLVQ
ncbi:UbiA family prenyltransferase [Nocardioides sp. JQ2195]|uniref:UbiA family prenyltransferase n=1 Tax=Nocardioides sp. JQ2195 TaxID=2592334 RepID=UPI00143E7C2F|nr:UbiA family prenyltransferase [Nocardioides sp. JQ2195]QIX25658.1 UbiA family prenyltransferase [Nocardioides sp. JQ2195]